MLSHMRTSVDIPDALLRRAKKLAQERGVSLRQLLLEGLRSVVERDGKTSTHRMRDCSFGTGGLVEGLAWSDGERMNELIHEE
jgi:hypothetical protein